MTTAPSLLVDEPAPRVLRLRINRPDKRNSIDLDVRQSILDTLADAAKMQRSRAIVFGGVGGVFSAGGDIGSMGDLGEDAARARMVHIHRVCRAIAALRVPVVTAVEGFGAGAAMGLALLGDWVVVNPASKILFPFLKLGLAPDWGLLRSLPLRIGLGPARRLLLEGRTLSGTEAHQIGLADQLVQDGDLMVAAVEKAAELAELPLDAFARIKTRLTDPARTFDEELSREEIDQVALLQSADFAEGVSAFREKRAARFGRSG